MKKFLVLPALILCSLLFASKPPAKLKVSKFTDTTVNVNFYCPCHPNGDIYPCSHPLHPAGDIGPCTHYDIYGNRIHTYDIYPCSHPLHPAGDIGPCTHYCPCY